MVTPELVSYIQAERAKNTQEPAIKSMLLANGWNEKDVSEAMSARTIAEPSKELLRYQWNRRTIIFSSLIVIYALWYGFLVWPESLNDHFFPPGLNFVNVVFFGICPVLAIVVSAYLSGGDMEPMDRQRKEIVDLVVRIIVAGFLAAMFWPFFAAVISIFFVALSKL